MSFLKKLFSVPSTRGVFYSFSVKCKRCGEVIHGQVNMNNEPSLEIDENGQSHYFCRKVLMGSGHCFERIEVELLFDENRMMQDHKVINGEWIETSEL